MFYYQTTYDSTLAADLGIIQICEKVYLAKNKGIPLYKYIIIYNNSDVTTQNPDVNPDGV